MWREVKQPKRGGKGGFERSIFLQQSSQGLRLAEGVVVGKSGDSNEQHCECLVCCVGTCVSNFVVLSPPNWVQFKRNLSILILKNPSTFTSLLIPVLLKKCILLEQENFTNLEICFHTLKQLLAFYCFENFYIGRMLPFLKLLVGLLTQLFLDSKEYLCTLGFDSESHI